MKEIILSLSEPNKCFLQLNNLNILYCIIPTFETLV